MGIVTRVALCVVFLLLLQQAPPLALAGDVKDSSKVVATVNGVPVYESALHEEGNRLFKKRKAIGMASAAGKLDGYQKLKALDSLIDKELVRQASSAQPVTDLDTKVVAKMAEIRGKYPTDEEFVKGLQKAGKSLDALTAEVRDGIVYDEYLKKSKITGVAVSDADIERFYKENALNLIVPEQIKVRHIVIDIEGDTSVAIEKAGQKARDVRDRVVREKDFAAVAREVSSCASAPQGGDLGYIKRGFMPVEFDQVAFALQVGEISGPVRTKHGFHIVEVLDKKPESMRPLAEVKDFIARYLQPFGEEERLKAHLSELRKKANIKIMLEEPVVRQ